MMFLRKKPLLNKILIREKDAEFQMVRHESHVVNHSYWDGYRAACHDLSQRIERGIL